MSTWLRHPVRAVLDWLGGLIVDRVFAHQAELRRIAADNDRQENPVTITVSLGALPRTGVLLTADCGVCGGTFRTVLPDENTAARCGVDHRCGTGVVGPLWTLVQPPAARVRRARPSIENAA